MAHRSNFEDVGQFHEKFGLPRSSDSHRAIPHNDTPRELLEFRAAFMAEELDEFMRAMERDDIPEMFDALLDLVYVALGTAHVMNLPWQAGWNRVQASNMAKVRAAKDGSDSKRDSSWDVVKPEGWIPPHLEELLTSLGWTPAK